MLGKPQDGSLARNSFWGICFTHQPRAELHPARQGSSCRAAPTSPGLQGGFQGVFQALQRMGAFSWRRHCSMLGEEQTAGSRTVAAHGWVLLHACAVPEHIPQLSSRLSHDSAPSTPPPHTHKQPPASSRSSLPRAVSIFPSSQ